MNDNEEAIQELFILGQHLKKDSNLLENSYQQYVLEMNLNRRLLELDKEIKKATLLKGKKTNFLVRQLIRIKRIYVSLKNGIEPNNEAGMRNAVAILEDHQKKVASQHRVVDRLLNELFDLNPQHLSQLSKMINERGEMLDFIKGIRLKRHKSDMFISQLLDFCSHVYKNHPDKEFVNAFYQEILNSYKPAIPPELLIRLREDRQLTLSHQDSFSTCLINRQRKNEIKTNQIEVAIDNKLQAYEFVAKLDIQVPKVFQKNVKNTDLEFIERTVVKPVNGAGGRGVYLIYSNINIKDLKKQVNLNSILELKDSILNDLEARRVSQNQWYVEELLLGDDIYSSARDLKFYTFFGKVGLILEIDRNDGTSYCWWNRNLERVDTGKYSNNLFVGDGVSIDEIEQVEKLSFEIPLPFVRIDFLRSDNKLVFGEFTPKPGNFTEFNERIDRELGTLFVDAEIRLFEELFSEQSFRTFKEFMIK